MKAVLWKCLRILLGSITRDQLPVRMSSSLSLLVRSHTVCHLISNTYKWQVSLLQTRMHYRWQIACPFKTMRLFTGLLKCKCSEVNSAPHFCGFAKAIVLNPIWNITALWGVRGFPSKRKTEWSKRKSNWFCPSKWGRKREKQREREAERAPRDPSQVGHFHILKVR